MTILTETDDATVVDHLPPRPPADSPGGVDLAFRPDIEGLRAVAVILVVIYHVNRPWLSGGYVGVDVFFVISGFLITGLLVKEHTARRSISLLGFYARRARRILPAASVVIFLTVAASYFIQNYQSFGYAAQDGRWASVFAANFHFLRAGDDYFRIGTAPSPLIHFWSLAVEEQFYLAWPLLVLLVGLLFRRFNIRWRVLTIATVAVGASFVWSVMQTNSYPHWAYFSPLTRAWELGLGAMLACLVPTLRRLPSLIGTLLAWSGLSAIATSAFLLTDGTGFPGYAALVPVLGAVAVIAGGVPGNGAGHLLSLRPIRSVGRVSFGWYLLHYPLLVILTGPIWIQPLSALEGVWIALATLVMAYFMYWSLERPIRRSEFWGRRPWPSIALGFGFVAGAFLYSWILHPIIHPLWNLWFSS